MRHTEPLFPKDDGNNSIVSTSELRIVLVGKTGAGKSSTANTILGRECFKKDVSPVSVTKTCECQDVMSEDRIISVIDTPGLFDTTMTEQKMKNEIGRCVEMSVPGPHAFLLVIRVGRFTEEEKNTVKWIQKNFGEEAARFTIVLFTHTDHLRGKPLNVYISESKDLQALVKDCSGRFHSFSNEHMENRSQVTDLLEKIEKMVEENGGQHYTDKMFQDAQSRILDRAQFWSGNPRIVLLGKAGSGKSLTGNTILGQESFKRRKSADSATETCERQEACVAGKSMKLIDTPGLIGAPEKKMKDEIEKLVFMSDPGPHVFLLVIRLDEKFTDEEKNWIQKNIGEDAVHHTIILFTHDDAVDDKLLEEYLRESNDLQALVNECGGRFHSFNNEDMRNRYQVTELLEKIETMAESNGWRYYTNDMFQNILKSYLRRLRNIALGTGSAGVAVIVSGGCALALTELIFPPAIIITLGGLAVAGAAGAAGAITNMLKKK